MTAALVALGSNLGDRHQNLELAIQLLAATPGIHVLAVSSPHATRPIGGPPGQDEFLNAAAVLETELSAGELFAVLRQIEISLGRRREQRWGARSLDLDLLLFGEAVIDSPDLQVPHPRMALRRFVLEPAAEVAPDMRHPTIDRTMAQLRDHLRNGPNYVAVVGVPGADTTRLAEATAQAVGGRFLADPARDWLLTRLLVKLKTIQLSERGTIGTELLRLRAEQLSQAVATAGLSPIISDYWPQQYYGMGAAGLALPAAQLPTVSLPAPGAVEPPATLELKIIEPKLLVWFDVPVRMIIDELQMSRTSSATADTLRQRLKESRAAIRSQVDVAGPPLKMSLDGADLPAAIDELSGAIQSMLG